MEWSEVAAITLLSSAVGFVVGTVASLAVIAVVMRTQKEKG